MRKVQLRETEDALTLLALTFADSFQNASVINLGRVQVASALGVHGGAGLRNEFSVFRMVCIVEAYVDMVGSLLFRKSLSLRSTLFETLVKEAEARSANTWEERKSSFSNYHKIPLTDCSRWADIDGLIVIRNAVAHGLGRLTDRQRNSKSINKLKSIDVNVIDGMVVLNRNTLVRCHKSCREFISSLDDRVVDVMSPRS